jgi:hypothetical protein
MKKLSVMSLLLVLAITVAGCSGATSDYTFETTSPDGAPQEVMDQIETNELERGHMLLDPGSYDVESTYVVIIDEDDISVSEHLVENGILRVNVDNSQNDDQVTEIDGYNVLVIETSLDTNIATIRNEDNLGYPGLLVQ